ncbi:MAG: hypothetical protein QXG05_08045 [Nitrososphaerota archaeon]
MKYYTAHKGENKPSIKEAVYKAMLLHEDLRESINSERLIKYVRAIPSLEHVKSSTIDRCRRLIQQDHPELRGKDWYYNQKHSRKKVARQISERTFGKKIGERNLSDYFAL